MTRPIEGSAPPVAALSAKQKGKAAEPGFRASLDAAAAEGEDAPAKGTVSPDTLARKTAPRITLEFVLPDAGQKTETAEEEEEEPRIEGLELLESAELLESVPGTAERPVIEQVATAVVGALPVQAAKTEASVKAEALAKPEPAVARPETTKAVAKPVEMPQTQTRPISDVVAERHHAPARPFIAPTAGNAREAAQPRFDAASVRPTPGSTATGETMATASLPDGDQPSRRAAPARALRAALAQNGSGARSPAPAPAVPPAGPNAPQSTDPTAAALTMRGAFLDLAPKGAPEPLPAQPALPPDTRGGVVKTLTLKLTPAELGEVAVRMRLTEAGLEVHLEPSRPETARMLRQDREAIAGLLRAAGYAADSGTVTVAERGAQSGGAGFGDTAQRGPGDGAQNGAADGRAGRSADQNAHTNRTEKTENQHEDATDSSRPSGALYL